MKKRNNNDMNENHYQCDSSEANKLAKSNHLRSFRIEEMRGVQAIILKPPRLKRKILSGK